MSESLRVETWAGYQVHRELHPDRLQLRRKHEADLAKRFKRLEVAVGSDDYERLLGGELPATASVLLPRAALALSHSAEATQESIDTDLEVLSAILDAGRYAGLWQDCPAPIPIAAIRPRPLLDTDRADWQVRYQMVRDAAYRALRADAREALDDRERAGRLVLWLAIESGVASVAIMRAVAMSMVRPVLATGAWRYIDLLHHGSTAHPDIRRLHLGPVCAALAIRDGTTLRPYGSASKTANTALRCYMRRVCMISDDQVPESLPALLRIVRGYLCLHLPPYLAAYSSGRIVSSSLEEREWRRHLGYAPRRNPPSGGCVHAIGDTDEEPTQPTLPAPRHDALLAIERILDRHRTAYDGIRDALAALLATTDIAVLARSVAEWTQARLLRTARNPGATRRAHAYAIHDARRVVALLHRGLGDAYGPESVEDIEALYLDLAALVSSAPSPRRTLRALSRWRAHYLHGDDADADSPQSKLPRCAIVSNRDLSRALELTVMVAHHHPQLSADDICLAILGGRLGMRPAEWVRMPRRDVHLSDTAASVVDIVPRATRRLKTHASRRRVPLGLLPTGMADRLLAILRVRVREARYDHALIADARGNPIATTIIEAAVGEVLRTATGIPEASLYLLRHTAASAWMLAVEGKHCGLDRISEELGELSAHLAVAERFREVVTGGRESLREGLGALHCLMGHSTYRTSCETYIHVLDLFFMGCLRQLTYCHDLGLVKAAAGFAPSTARRSRLPDIESTLQCLERRMPHRVLREDTGLSSLDGDASEVIYQECLALWDTLAAAVDGAKAELPAGVIERSVRLHGVATGKRGSCARPHGMRQSSAEEVAVPPLLRGASARHAACCTIAMLRSVGQASRHDLDQLLGWFAVGLAAGKGRVTYATVKAFAHAYAVLTTHASHEIVWGRGVRQGKRAYSRANRLARVSGRYWISIASPTVAGGKRSVAGGVWAWQMIYLCPDLLR